MAEEKGEKNEALKHEMMRQKRKGEPDVNGCVTEDVAESVLPYRRDLPDYTNALAWAGEMQLQP